MLFGVIIKAYFFSDEGKHLVESETYTNKASSQQLIMQSELMFNGCVTVGRAVTSETRGLGMRMDHISHFNRNIYLLRTVANLIKPLRS